MPFTIDSFLNLKFYYKDVITGLLSIKNLQKSVLHLHPYNMKNLGSFISFNSKILEKEKSTI